MGMSKIDVEQLQDSSFGARIRALRERLFGEEVFLLDGQGVPMRHGGAASLLRRLQGVGYSLPAGVFDAVESGTAVLLEPVPFLDALASSCHVSDQDLHLLTVQFGFDMLRTQLGEALLPFIFADRLFFG